VRYARWLRFVTWFNYFAIVLNVGIVALLMHLGQPAFLSTVALIVCCASLVSLRAAAKKHSKQLLTESTVVLV
jgi:hypothetical protein